MRGEVAEIGYGGSRDKERWKKGKRRHSEAPLFLAMPPEVTGVRDVWRAGVIPKLLEI